MTGPGPAASSGQAAALNPGAVPEDGHAVIGASISRGPRPAWWLRSSRSWLVLPGDGSGCLSLLFHVMAFELTEQIEEHLAGDEIV